MRFALTAALALASGAVSACIFVHAEDDSLSSHDRAMKLTTGERAVARIESSSGSTLTGKATFTEVEGGLLVEIEVHHAPPGWHAVHVHETGDCSAPDAASAGAHFNPAGKNHGSPHAEDHHAGDLGSMSVDEDGEGRHVLLAPDLALSGTNSVQGRAIVIHASIDDLTSQPSGNAGARIGCGVIR